MGRKNLINTITDQKSKALKNAYSLFLIDIKLKNKRKHISQGIKL